MKTFMYKMIKIKKKGHRKCYKRRTLKDYDLKTPFTKKISLFFPFKIE